MPLRGYTREGTDGKYTLAFVVLVLTVDSVFLSVRFRLIPKPSICAMSLCSLEILSHLPRFEYSNPFSWL